MVAQGDLGDSSYSWPVLTAAQQLGKRAQSAASVPKVASWSLEGLYPHSGKQLLGVEWREIEKYPNLSRQVKTEILAVIQAGRMQRLFFLVYLYIIYKYLYITLRRRQSPVEHRTFPLLFGSPFWALRICLWFEKLSWSFTKSKHSSSSIYNINICRSPC